MPTPPNDMKLDTAAMTRVVVAAITEAMTHADGAMGWVLVIGKPDTTEDVSYASNIQSTGAIDALEAVVQLLKLRAFEPVDGALPH